MQPDQFDPDPYRDLFRVRKTIGALLLAALIGLAAFFSGGRDEAEGQEIRFFQIATGPGGGTYFPIGSTLANAISNPPGSPPCELGGSCGVPGLVGTAQITDGSQANIAALRTGAVQSAIVQADTAFLAFSGLGPFQDAGPYSDLRVIAALYTEALHVVVSADGPEYAVADLEGIRVGLGAEGSSALATGRMMMEAHGLSLPPDLVSALSPEQAADGMLSAALDAMITVGGVPIPAIEDMGRRIPLRLLPITAGPELEVLLSQPFFTRATIPEGIYAGTATTPTIGIPALWVVSAEADADTVYAITEALWNDATREQLDRGHPQGRAITVETALDGIPLPLHDGALAYYREIEMIAPAHEDSGLEAPPTDSVVPPTD